MLVGPVHQEKVWTRSSQSELARSNIHTSTTSPPRRLFGMLWYRVNASNACQAPGGRQHTSSSTFLRRATESSEPYVIAALAQRWSGLFSYSAANAVAQLKS